MLIGNGLLKYLSIATNSCFGLLELCSVFQTVEEDKIFSLCVNETGI